MRTFLQNKLWRDLMLDRLAQEGSQFVWERLDDLPYDLALRSKLAEEAAEVAAAEDPEDLAEELADILEVVCALCEHHHFSFEQVRQIQEAKRLRNGSYSQRIFIHTADHPVGSSGEAWCLAQPHKYPEVVNPPPSMVETTC